MPRTNIPEALSNLPCLAQSDSQELTGRAMRHVLMALATVCFSMMDHLNTAGAAELVVPINIREALRRNAEALNPMVLHYKLERVRRIPEEAFVHIVQGPNWIKGDTGFLNPITIEYNHHNGRTRIIHHCRFSTIEEIPSNDTSTTDRNALLKITGTKDWIIEIAFDGTKLYVGNRREAGRPVLLIETPVDEPKSAIHGYGNKPRFPATFLKYVGLRAPESLHDYQQRMALPVIVIEFTTTTDGWPAIPGVAAFAARCNADIDGVA